MTQAKINELRKEVDKVNLEILRLLSSRGKLVEEIGWLQTELGLSHYDPVREEEMLKMITEHNQGPYSNDIIKKIFKEIFKASMYLEDEEEKKGLLVSRRRKREDTIIELGEVIIGKAGEPVIIAGPCSIESRPQLEAIAEKVSELGVKILRGGAFKPRTSPYSFQGLGEEGLKIMRSVANKYNMLAVTEVVDTRGVELVEEYADMFQIGARNMSNFELLKAVGRAKKPVVLKRGYMSTMEEYLFAAEYIISQGNDRIILCERGIRTFEQWTRNTLDISAVALLKGESHLPIIVDISHSAGRKDIAIPLAKAALAVGADGIMMEVHNNPEVALSDGAQQLNLSEFEDLMEGVSNYLS